jgi:peptidyl-prolyl cis-trans isomerase B (cyclophilin B)
LSGKSAKRNKRREKEAAREAARRKQRQQTIFTLIVIAIIVAIGGVLIAVSIERPEELAEAPEATEAATEDPTEGPTGTGDPAETPIERPVACGAEAPPAAGQERPTFTDVPEQVLEEGVDYGAVIETSCGALVLDLDEARAPQAVNSFVFLAQQGFFDGLEIFRNATSIGALQTGAGTNEATWQIGYTLTDELAVAEAEGYPPGSVAMANSGPDTSGSQFFFVYNPLFDSAFEGQRVYTRFAMVTEGLEALEQIGAIPVDGETPTEVVYMDNVTIMTGGGEPAPEETPDAAPDAAPGTEPATEPTD